MSGSGYIPGSAQVIALTTLEAAAAFDEELLEDEMAGQLRPDGSLEELQSLVLWRTNRALRTVIEERAEPRREAQRWREHYRRRDAERAAMAAAELEHRRQLEAERLEAWDAIFAIGLPLKR